MKRMLCLLVAASAIVSGAHAQMPNLNPPEELKKLEWMVGEWSGTAAMEMEGMKFESKQTLKVDWDGKFVRMTAVMDMMGMKMTETMYVGYDPATKKYVSYAFTNFSAFPRIERGGYEGDKFVMTSDPWQVEGAAAPTVSRATLSKAGADMGFLLEFKVNDKWVTAGKGTYAKKKV